MLSSCLRRFLKPVKVAVSALYKNVAKVDGDASYDAEFRRIGNLFRLNRRTHGLKTVPMEHYPDVCEFVLAWDEACSKPLFERLEILHSLCKWTQTHKGKFWPRESILKRDWLGTGGVGWRINLDPEDGKDIGAFKALYQCYLELCPECFPATIEQAWEQAEEQGLAQSPFAAIEGNRDLTDVEKLTALIGHVGRKITEKALQDLEKNMIPPGYEIRERLSPGVYLLWDHGLSRTIVMKRKSAGLLQWGKTAWLQHPNVVRLLFDTEHHVFMEKVDGVPADTLFEDSPFPEQETVHLIRDWCKGLVALSWHGDLHGGNAIATRDEHGAVRGVLIDVSIGGSAGANGFYHGDSPPGPWTDVWMLGMLGRCLLCMGRLRETAIEGWLYRFRPRRGKDKITRWVSFYLCAILYTLAYQGPRFAYVELTEWWFWRKATRKDPGKRLLPYQLLRLLEKRLEKPRRRRWHVYAATVALLSVSLFGYYQIEADPRYQAEQYALAQDWEALREMYRNPPRGIGRDQIAVLLRNSPVIQVDKWDALKVNFDEESVSFSNAIIKPGDHIKVVLKDPFQKSNSRGIVTKVDWWKNRPRIFINKTPVYLEPMFKDGLPWFPSERKERVFIYEDQ
ncbi:MAG: hypothetical protein QNK37_29585 [Acidobacteriota bacterium]|nr:hypothetical protein [Acidobacteriota bacterium]